MGRTLAATLALVAVTLLAGCGSQQESGDQVATDLIATLHGSQFYESASRAQCEPVEVKAGAISDCTVWFRQPIFQGDSTRKHNVRVIFADDQGHFSYTVSG